MSTGKHSEVIAASLLLGFSIFAWIQASEIQGGAAIFPKLTVYVLTFFSAIYLIRSVLASQPNIRVMSHVGAFTTLMICAVLYINGVVYVGYVTSSVIFIPICAWLVGFRRPIYICVVTLIYVVSVYLLFEVVFDRPLPAELLVRYLHEGM